MVYNSLDYWVFGLSPSPGILKTQIRQRFGNWICFRPQVRGGVELHVYYPSALRRKQIQFPKLCCFIEYQTMDKVQNPAILNLEMF
jgi:hypothetical protein